MSLAERWRACAEDRSCPKEDFHAETELERPLFSNLAGRPPLQPAGILQRGRRDRPVCHDHASVESKFTTMTMLTAVLLRSLDRQPSDPQMQGTHIVGEPTPAPEEIATELRRIFGKDFERAERA